MSQQLQGLNVFSMPDPGTNPDPDPDPDRDPKPEFVPLLILSPAPEPVPLLILSPAPVLEYTRRRIKIRMICKGQEDGNDELVSPGILKRNSFPSTSTVDPSSLS
jgi:hypothetical protein